MDNFDLVNYNEGEELPEPDPEVDKPIPFDDSDSVSGPEKAHSDTSHVSRTPLTLGSNQAGAKQEAKPAAKSTEKPASTPAAAPGGPVSQAAHPGKITHLKTFFTKLHPGALVFMDEQITEWLKNHPEVTVKKTNVTVGEVQAKKTEPNLIVNIWY